MHSHSHTHAHTQNKQIATVRIPLPPSCNTPRGGRSVSTTRVGGGGGGGARPVLLERGQGTQQSGLDTIRDGGLDNPLKPSEHEALQHAVRPEEQVLIYAAPPTLEAEGALEGGDGVLGKEGGHKVV